MVRKSKWALALSAVLLTSAFARADLLAQKVDQDLFFSYLNSSKPDRYQIAFKSLGVDQAPSNPPLNTDEQAQLKTMADKLWNREYELTLLQKEGKPVEELNQQKARIKIAVKEYNKRIEDVIAERAANSWKKSITQAPSIQTCHELAASAPPAAIANLAGNVAPVILPAIHSSQVVEERQNRPEPLLVSRPQVAAAKPAPAAPTAKAQVTSTAAISPIVKAPAKITAPVSSVAKTPVKITAPAFQVAKTQVNFAAPVLPTAKAPATISAPVSPITRAPVKFSAPASEPEFAPVFSAKPSTSASRKTFQSPPMVTSSTAPVKINLPGSSTNFESDFVMTMVKDPTNSSVVYGVSGAVGEKYLLRSTDGGKKWSRLDPLPSSFFKDDNLYDHLAVGAGGKEIFLTTTQGIFQSVDGGANFSYFAPAVSAPANLTHEASDVKLSSDGAHLAVSYGTVLNSNSNITGSTVALFEKKDGVWQKSASQPSDISAYSNQKFAQDPACQSSSDACAYISGHVQILSVQTDPTNPQVVYAGTGRGIYRWQPGSGWSILKGVWGDTTVDNIDISPKTGELMLSGCNGVYHGKVDQPGGSVIPDSQVHLSKFQSGSFLDQRYSNRSNANYLRTFDVVSRENNPQEIVATGASGVYFSKDGGGTWKRAAGGDLPQTTVGGADAEFHSAVWLSDGSVEVSGPSGTYQFKP